MNYINCTSTEQALLDTMDAEEKTVYLASEADLVRLSTVPLTKCSGWFILHQFVEVSLLITELHKRHDQYNDVMDHMATMPNNTEEAQKTYEILNEAADSVFIMSTTVGFRSTTIDLTNMDICGVFYRMLGDLKINLYHGLFDHFKLSDLSQHCQGYYLR